MTKIIEVKDFEDLEKIENNSDILSALSLISEFWDVHCCAIVKNGFPIGVALSGTPYEAKIKALDCNPIDAIGETIAFSKEIDEKTAKALHRMKFNTIISTEISSEALKFLEKESNRIIKIDFRLDLYKKYISDNVAQELTPKGFKVATKLKPTQEQVEDMVFAWKVLKTIQQDGILISKDFKTCSIETGTDIEAMERVMDKACDGSKEAILAISRNITDTKHLHPAIQGRITGIIEPKNFSGKDKEVLKMADKYGITVITVGAEE